jgi:uncharacterized protein
MKRTLYIVFLSLLMVGAASGIAFLVYPDFEADRTEGRAVSAGSGAPAPDKKTDSEKTDAPETSHPDEKPSPNPAVPAGPAWPDKRLYLILDDGGHALDHLRWFSDFPGVFTVAVLPGLPHSRETARMTVAMGHELMLHQPMEALGGNDPGPGAVYTVQRDHRIQSVVRRNLAQFPDAIGVNNHMGSKATKDLRVMNAVASVLAHRNLFFLDSRTSAESVVETAAVEAGLPPLRRDVFLDNIRTEEAISSQLDEALDVAAEHGRAVMIGHITSPELARVLVSRYDEISAAGYGFFPVSDLVNLVAGEEQRIAHEDSGN